MIKKNFRHSLDPRKRILSSKFCPPNLAEDRTVFRSELFTNTLLNSDDKRYIFMEAQAGQGKTTTALQYISNKSTPYAWYQIAEEDCDPLFFFTSIFEVLNQTLDTLSALHIIDSIPIGLIEKADIPEVLKKITNKIASLTSLQLIFVFDDLHIIQESPEVISVLDSFLDTSPENIQFLLLSRAPIPLNSKRVKFGSSTLYLTNESLAFSLHETLELLNLLNVKYSSHDFVQHLHTVTEGWVMGLILAKDSSKNLLDETKRITSKDLGSLKLDQYFKEVLLSVLSEELQNDLLKLSLLEEIPCDLAELITGNSNISADLDELMVKNHFIKLTDADIETYTFHHLMRESFRTEYLHRFSNDERISVLKSAINHYLSEGLIERVVVYILRLGLLSEVETFLEKYCLELVARNRLGTLKKIPGELIKNSSPDSPWLQFFQGILLAESKPDEGINHLLRSADLFLQTENNHGRLLALSQVIFHQVLTSIDLENGYLYLEEATEIYNQIHDDLSIYYQIFICRNLGAGYLVFTGDLETSRQFSGKALTNAQALQIPNMIVASWVFLGYAYAVPGLFHAARKIAELLYDHILTHEVGASNKAFAHHFLTDILEMTGDYLNYTRYKQKYSSILENNFFSKTQMIPSVTLWDIKFHFAHNRIDKALTLIEESEYLDEIYNTAHVNSRMLEWKALCKAVSGARLPEVQTLVEDSRQLRTKSSWGGFYTARHHILLGAALSIAGDRSGGEKLITKGIENSKKLSLPMLEVSGLLLRAYSSHLGGDKETFAKDLTKGLGLMRFHNYDMFWGWNPSILRYLFREGMKEGIELSFINRLCAERFSQGIQKDGQIHPYIEIQILGDLQLSIAGEMIANSKTFTPMQRRFISILVASPATQISLEKAEDSLWPETSREKSRRNLDTLISRLRSLLRPLIQPYSINNYLVMSHGLISLKNCRVDAIEFRRIIQRGFTHADNDEWWQAGNLFTSADGLWGGCFALDSLTDTLTYDYCLELRNEYLRMADCWAKFLLGTGQYSEALHLLVKARKIHPSHDGITSYLYHLYIRKYDSDSAKKTLAHYRNALQHQGVPEDEIESLIDSVISPLDK